MWVHVSATVVELTLIKDIHQIMTVLPGSNASWDLSSASKTAIKDADDVPQQDSSCFC